MTQETREKTSDLALAVTDLRCEGLTDPLGVEVETPRLSWRLESEGRGVFQAAYYVQAAATREALLTGSADLWDSGEIASGQSLGVPYGGLSLRSGAACFWRVRVTDQAGRRRPWSEPARWERGLLAETDWTAQWIGRPGVAQVSWEAAVLPAPLLRREFALPGRAVRARAYVCGLGYYELSLNGRKVGERVLEPIVTQYDRHAGYSTLDVTDYLTQGANAVGVMLGNGWYNCHTAEVWHFDKAPWRDYPKLLFQMDVTLDTGETVRVGSDGSWRVADGPIRFDGLRNGETYDAREEKPGWDGAGYDASAWQPAAVVPGPGGRLFSQQAPPCAVTETIEAISEREFAPGIVVYDFGQNVSGWVRLTGSAPAGTELTLRYGERLGEDGRLDVTHIAMFVKSGDFQTDRYTFKGESQETWEPRFTYHGFQYVEATGLENWADVSLQARFVHSDFAPVGRLKSSDPTLNQLADCTLRSYRSNFVGIPTDCPHREKNGWTGDAQIAVETGLFSFDAAPAYAHWLRTLADAQRPSGQLPGIVPTGGWGFNWGNGPAWDGVCVAVPWNAYLFRGETRILEDNYPTMRLYGQFLQTMLTDGLIRWGLGDWCSPDNDRTAPSALVTTAYAYECFQRLSVIAGLLERADEADDYARLAETMREAWRREWLRADGHCAGDEQTSLACALYFGFAEPEERVAVTERLLDAITDAGGKPTFGIHGAKWTLRALSEAGRTDVAYRLLTQPEFPGWVHWLSQGATTLWEDWHGGSSRNHIMYGDILAWTFTHLAGIRPDPAHPGFARFTLAPQPVPELEWARAEHDGPFGTIRCGWRREGGGVLRVQATVPPNSEADVFLPAKSVDDVTEGGQPPTEADGLRVLPSERGVAIRCASGTYDFSLAAADLEEVCA